MKFAWLIGLAFLIGAIAALLLRTERTTYSGYVLGPDTYQLDGVKGETSIEWLPEHGGPRLRNGDRLHRTDSWNRDLKISYERFDIERDGQKVGRFYEGVGRFSITAGAIAAAPLVLGLILTILWGCSRPKANVSP